jgi:DNA-binding IclR family transcriptional regulator
VSSGLPEPIARFIERYVESLDYLEILFLLHRSDSAPTCAEVAQALRLERNAVATYLDAMVRDGLADKSNDPEPRFTFKGGALDAEVRALEHAYSERRVAVLTAIFTRPNDRVRLFADAFRIKKDKP